MATTSAFVPIGTLLQLGNAASPEVFATIAEVTGLKLTPSKQDKVDATNMGSPNGFREFIAGLRDASDVDVTANFIPADTQQIAVNTSFTAGAKHNWKIVLPSSLGTFSFAGFVDAVGWNLDFSKQGEVTFKIFTTGQVTLA